MMTTPTLEWQRGKLAGLNDRRKGRSYAECGEDESNTEWNEGYATGWYWVDNESEKVDVEQYRADYRKAQARWDAFYSNPGNGYC